MAGEYRQILDNTLDDKELNNRFQSKELMIAHRSSIIGNVTIIEDKNIENKVISALEMDNSPKSNSYWNGLMGKSMVIVRSFNGKTDNEHIIGEKDINYFNT